MSNTKVKLSFLLLSIIMASCSRSSLPPEPSNFAFRYRSGIARWNVLNTFSKTFTYDLVKDGSITVPFTVPDSEKILVWDKLNTIHFFDLPDSFELREPDTGIVILKYPVNHSDLLVRYGAKTKYVQWNDEVVPDSIRQRRLFSLDSLFWFIITHNPEFAKLPEPRGGYE